MSRTYVKAIYRGDRSETIAEFGNSFRSAPPVWEAMAGRYLGVTTPYGIAPKKGWMQLEGELWDLWKRTDIPVEHRAVFMLTFDRAYVSRENFPRMAHAIHKFIADFWPSGKPETHWPGIACILEDAKRDIPGLGLHCTSVSSDPFLGPWNEEKEQHDPVDWNQIYEVYEQLDSLECEKS
jgi:hypothetical protein